MKALKSIVTTTLIITALAVTSTANALLMSRLGGQAYYDTDANLTWLTDANAAGTTMNWADSNAWAAGYSVGGVNGWRLATTEPAVTGLNQTGSEMGNLFYNVLGGSAGTSIATLHNTNYELFSNVQSSYWSATEYAPVADYGFAFYMSNGGQGANPQDDLRLNAWAVQSGDVAVPAPSVLWLIGGGLIAFGVVRRKTRA